MDLRQLTLVVMTVDREPQYVHQTLASMFAAEPLVHEFPEVHLMIGTSKSDYLGHYRHHRVLRLHPLPDAEQQAIEGWTPHRRFCHNYVRCLSLTIPDGGGICVCEDDLVFRDGFLQRLLLAINEMEGEAGLEDYCLALFSEADFEADPSVYRGMHYCSYGCDYHGTQCMYYPKPVARRLRDYIQEHGVEHPTKPGDLLVGDLYGDRMYACSRALADHTGRVSTGLGGSGRSPSFSRPFVPISREEWGRLAQEGHAATPAQAQLGRVLAVVLLSGHLDLLEQFLEYFMGLGVDGFLVHINDQTGDGEFVDAAREIMDDYPTTVTDVWTGPYDHYQRVEHDARALERHMNEGDWVLIPDLDEFPEYSMPLRDLLRECQEAGYNAIRGHFVDRLSVDGHLPEFRRDECAFSQFPNCAQVTGRLLKAQTRVLTAVRGTVPKNRHFVTDGSPALRGQALRFCPTEDVRVHHFKWSANAISRMRTRYLRYKELHDAGSGAYGFFEEGKRCLDYLEARGGAFDLDDPDLEVVRDGRCLCQRHPPGVKCSCSQEADT